METTTNKAFISIFKKLTKPLKPKPTDTEPSLKKLKNIQCIAFDFYGTMFISAVGDIGMDDGSASVDTFTSALDDSELTIIDKHAAHIGFDLYDVVVDDHCHALENQGYDIPEPDIRSVWTDVLSSLKQKRLIQGTIGEEVVSKFAIEFEVRMNPIWPMPGLLQILKTLQKEEVELSIISNSQFYTPIAFEALTGGTIADMGFNEELLHWSYEEKLKKPSTRFYESYLKKLTKYNSNIKPGQVLYVGNDMLKDVYPASELGFKTALFAGDERSLKWRKEDKRCKDLNPDLVITELNQLLECI